MSDKNAESTVTTTPINADRHKNADPNRNPETDVKVPAEKERDNAMRDCPETTILMRFSQFLEEELFDLARDFDQHHRKDYAKDVWWAFHSEAETTPKQPRVKKSWRAITEKTLSNIWENVDSQYHLVPNHFLHISDSHYESTDPSLSKIDGSFIQKEKREAIRPSYPNWADMEMLVEFKRGGTGSDPFDDRCLYSPDANAKTRIAVRGQVMSYSERLFSYQHRSAVFFLLVNSDMFRVMRWDRSGVVVTEAIDYIGSIEGTKALLQVTYAFTRLQRALQGVDTSAIRLVEQSCGWQRMDLLAQPSPHDLDHAEVWFDGDIHEVFKNPEVAAKYGRLPATGSTVLHRKPITLCSGHKSPLPVIPVFSYVRKMFRDSLVPGYPRYRLTVDGEEYLVGKHIFLGAGMVGRGTRGYVALEWKTQRFVFLKDCWRPDYKGVEAEGEILSKLNAAGVNNVPTVVRYGDVYDKVDRGHLQRQETEASRYHPFRGTKKVKTDLPPFQDTIHPSSKEKKLARFLKKAQSKDSEVDNAKSTVALTDPLHKTRGNLKAVVSGSDASSDATGAAPATNADAAAAAAAAASAPPANAFGPSMDIPTTQSPPATGRGTKRKLDALLAGDKRNPGEGLRHMIHSRMVVQEICLPLTAFTSTWQFVHLISECIMAHEMAYTQCKYMHRDVSAGNMLIYPEIVCDSNGKYGVYWKGILADWELAKHSDSKIARQPQRTGTWHFMSAFLLLNPTMPTTIADELEAFLHVLIYGCIRRVRSNLETIHEFLTDYFAGGSYDPFHQQTACPSAKQQSVVLGNTLMMTTREIVFSTPDGKIAKEHPINALIAELLDIFHSRYHVLQWQSASNTKPGAPPKSPTARKTRLPGTWHVGYPGRREALQSEASKRKKGKVPARRIGPPTQEMLDNVEALEEHSTIGDILDHYVRSGYYDWPDDDVVPDRQAEPIIEKAPRRAHAPTGGAKKKVPPIPEAEEPEDVPNSQGAEAEGVPIPDVDEADKLEGGSFVPDVPVVDPSSIHSNPPSPPASGDLNLTTAQKTARDEPDAPIERPRKRRRKDPVVQEADGNVLPEVADSALPTRRVTRSRSGAKAPAAPTPAARQPVAKQADHVAPPTRVTRSRSGKLPSNNPTGRAGPSTSSGGPTVRRGARTRATAAAAAADRPARRATTRQRSAASQSAAKEGRSRRTRGS